MRQRSLTDEQRRARYDAALAERIRDAERVGADDLAAELRRERLANALKDFRNTSRPYGRQPMKETA